MRYIYICGWGFIDCMMRYFVARNMACIEPTGLHDEELTILLSQFLNSYRRKRSDIISFCLATPGLLGESSNNTLDRIHQGKEPIGTII